MMYSGYGSGWGLLLVVGSMAVFWVLVIGAVLLIAPRAGGQSPTRTPAPTVTDAQQILAGRYVRGEIDYREYHARRAALRAHTPPDRVADDDGRRQ